MKLSILKDQEQNV